MTDGIITSDFAQILKHAKCVMTITQCNSSNSLTAGLNELCSKKEIIWMNSLP